MALTLATSSVAPPVDLSAVLRTMPSAPLYAPERGEFDELVKTVTALRTLSGQHETYCPECRKDALFRIVEDSNAIEQAQREQRERKLAGAVTGISPRGRSVALSIAQANVQWLGEFKLHMRCMRKSQH